MLNDDRERLPKAAVGLILSAVLVISIMGSRYSDATTKTGEMPRPTETISLKNQEQPNEDVSQDGKLIYLRWGEDREDDSTPPIEWPKPLGVRSRLLATIGLTTDSQPQQVEIRVWRRIRPNGKPIGRPLLMQCGAVPKSSDECIVTPVARFPQPKWEIHLGSEWNDAHHAFVAVYVLWDSKHEASWIHRLDLED